MSDVIRQNLSMAADAMRVVCVFAHGIDSLCSMLYCPCSRIDSPRSRFVRVRVGALTGILSGSAGGDRPPWLCHCLCHSFRRLPLEGNMHLFTRPCDAQQGRRRCTDLRTHRRLNGLLPSRRQSPQQSDGASPASRRHRCSRKSL